MSQLSLINLRISTHSSPPSSKSGSNRSSTSSIQSDSSTGSETDGPAAYHVNLLNLIPSLQLPPPLRGMSRLRATAQRQFAPRFDALGILAKAVMRPQPVIHLGPIGTSRQTTLPPQTLKVTDVNTDHTASCVIVDLDLPDRPLVWASDSFCQMSGYALEDIRGRNPRFMQAPGGHVLSPPNSDSSDEDDAQSGPAPNERFPPSTSPHDVAESQPQPSRPPPVVVPGSGSGSSSTNLGSSTETVSSAPKPEDIPAPTTSDAYIHPPQSHVSPGSQRTHTNHDTVRYIKSKLDANEELQCVVLNYRKDGTPFWNWLSVVPVPGFNWDKGGMLESWSISYSSHNKSCELCRPDTIFAPNRERHRWFRLRANETRPLGAAAYYLSRLYQPPKSSSTSNFSCQLKSGNSRGVPSANPRVRKSAVLLDTITAISSSLVLVASLDKMQLAFVVNVNASPTI
ncbi:hypothetical protein AG1IA_04894 [Rhizoctonia solani AG-1 IA]|uniref:PAS domain-containing protein n=1 Tax=Thanatephorus cucumeris (strain AG1-IA) TaxID=983506 RepID=L8WSF6_THACA|nr:hypothetical protein AG1IA_04894 [Rhizoctonia solani AG-1 IA]